MNQTPLLVSTALLLVAGPFAVGKTVITDELTGFLGLKKSVSVTTRPPRPDEVDGVNYHFKSPAEFLALVRAGAFLEYATINGHWYGTLKQFVLDSLANGERLILTLDVQGLKSLRSMEEDIIQHNLMSVYLHAPIETLIRRALKRPGGMADEELGRRVKRAIQIEDPERAHFDLILENLDGSFEQNVKTLQRWFERRIIERDADR